MFSITCQHLKLDQEIVLDTCFRTSQAAYILEVSRRVSKLT